MLSISGPNKLHGEVRIHGAKNSTLPLLAASLLTGDETVFHNCPDLSDVKTALSILEMLGCRVTREKSDIVVDSSNVYKCEISDSLMREMRSSIVFLGAIISRMRQAKISFPGGCELGPRPIDLHLDALRKMGARIEEEHGCLSFHVDGRLQGCYINFSFPSVGATENVMIAASLAKGITIISNAAREPEIEDLANYLNACGAKIRGAGESTIVVEGVERLHGCEHTVIPDRIEAVTYMAATAITGSLLLLRNIAVEHLRPLFPIFEESGCILHTDGRRLLIQAPERLHRLRAIRTMPYPGFPTDAQAPVLAMTTMANGTSIFIENIFESRYKYTAELQRLGANIKVEGRVAVVEGVSQLTGAPVQAPDLRGGAALIVAGLAAEGVTQITGVKHIDRGYEAVEKSLLAIGAQVKREVTNVE